MSAPATRVWIAGIGAVLASAGCGFKGPLYLPERNATVITHPAQGAQAPGQTQTPATKSKSKTPPQPPGSTPTSPQPPPSGSPPSSSQ